MPVGCRPQPLLPRPGSSLAHLLLVAVLLTAGCLDQDTPAPPTDGQRTGSSAEGRHSPEDGGDGLTAELVEATRGTPPDVGEIRRQLRRIRRESLAALTPVSDRDRRLGDALPSRLPTVVGAETRLVERRSDRWIYEWGVRIENPTPRDFSTLVVLELVVADGGVAALSRERRTVPAEATVEVRGEIAVKVASAHRITTFRARLEPTG